ncbi:MAG: ATP-binding protein [Chloroflexota bacterium]
MLIEFTLGNYRSFREPQTLSMVASSLKSKDPNLDENSVIQVANNPSLLTSAAVYGANASGKSNLVQAIAFMRSFVLNSAAGTSTTGGIDVEPFRLNTSTLNQPSHFEILFVESGKRYRYGFEATTERVTAEWLYFVPSTREARLFEREDDQIDVGNYFKEEGRDLAQHTRPNALFLSVVAQFNGPIAQKLVTWFRRLEVISRLDELDIFLRILTLAQFLAGEQGQAIRNLIGRLDLGITDLQVEKAAGPKTQPAAGILKEMGREYLHVAGTPETEQLYVRTVHTRYDDKGNPAGEELFNLVEHESDGTQKLFALSGLLLAALQAGGMLIVDELDVRLHPLLTREIIALFNKQRTKNVHKAQLIFTSHDTNLLDNSLFRRDQIWFVEKDQKGASHLYSLAEFKVRNDKDYERGYIQGRYGAIPYLSHIQTIVSGGYGEKA